MWMGFGAFRSEFADEGDEFDAAPVVGVDERREGLRDAHGAAEFFLKFTMQGGLGGFAGLDFATGKFPQAAELFIRRTLREHDELATNDDGADDGHGRGRFH